MPKNEDHYYAGGKKIKLNRLTDSIAVRYKEIPSRATVRKLSEKAAFAEAEERKEMPKHRMVIVTLPASRRLADVEDSVKDLENDPQVDSVLPVFREAQSGLRLIATDEITVRFKSNVSKKEIENFYKENGVEIIEQNRFMPNQYLLRVKNPKDTLAVADKLQESGWTEFVEPNFISEARKAALPNDVLIKEQWHIDNTGQGGGKPEEDVSASEAWDITTGSSDIVIAIIDDGVDIDHPDLKANIWENPNPDNATNDVNGWNFYDNNNNPRPRKFTPPYSELAGNDSHGTPCAGVAAAVGDNATGVTGIAYKCKILPAKIFLGDDLVPFNIIADAIRYAGQRADVLSNSWGIPPSGDVESAIKDVVRAGRGGKGTPVFVASGNEYNSTIGFPASVPEAIAVGASTNRGERSDYSNYGEGLDFVAPSSGGTKGIFTTDVSINGRGFNVGDINQGGADGLYTNSFGGTSSATPLAAGVAALILSLNPELTWDQVRGYMQDTADKIDPVNANYVNGYSLEYGYGRINAYMALKKVKEDMENGSVVEVIDKQINPALPIPDNDLKGIISTLDINEEGTADSVEVSVDISHTYRGDLLVSLLTPANEIIPLHEGEGGRADDLINVYDSSSTPALHQLKGKEMRGKWSLKVVDRARKDTGTLNSWGLKAKVLKKENVVKGSDSPGLHIPDDDPVGITRTLDFQASGRIKDIKVNVDISHTYVGDLTVKLTSPSNKEVTLHDKEGGSVDNIQTEYTITKDPQLRDFLDEQINGTWTLAVADHAGMDVGKLNRWGIEARI
ncbi:Halolysin [uncultured archaeon]|nr:Halolysin [uncultured archaeon]